MFVIIRVSILFVMKTLAFANSLALTGGVIWVIFSIIIWLFPSLALYLFKVNFMGLEGIDFTGFNLDLTTFLGGLILTVIVAWIFGYIWAALYNKFVK